MQHKIKKMNENTYYTKKRKRGKWGNPSSTYILNSSKYLKFNLNIPAYIHHLPFVAFISDLFCFQTNQPSLHYYQ